MIAIVDVLIIVILLASIVLGYKKGLSGMALTLASTVVPAVLAWIFCRTVAEKLMQVSFFSKFTEKIANKMIGSITNERILNGLIGLTGKTEIGMKEGLQESMMVVGSFILILIVGMVIFKLISKIIGKKGRIPVLTSVDHLCGLGLGIIFAVVVSTLLVLALYFFFEFRGNEEQMENISRAIIGGRLLKFFVH